MYLSQGPPRKVLLQRCNALTHDVVDITAPNRRRTSQTVHLIARLRKTEHSEGHLWSFFLSAIRKHVLQVISAKIQHSCTPQTTPRPRTSDCQITATRKKHAVILLLDKIRERPEALLRKILTAKSPNVPGHFFTSFFLSRKILVLFTMPCCQTS